jgi:tetratricopeptide (TPR) repeat protein
MNGWKRCFIAGVAFGVVPAFAQPAPFALPDLDGLMAQADAALAKADNLLGSNLARASQFGLLFQGRNNAGRFDVDYDRGTRALDDHKYEEAVRRFDAVVDSKSARADGALYWKAYALNRLGRRDDAIAALAALRRDYPASHWLNDAQALEAEVKQGSGQGVSPAQETNEDLKLMAINSLMNADPDRAMPLLEGLLKGNSTPKVKDRAMFVLTQNRSARAQQILAEYAKGVGNPDLQVRAIRYIGMSGTTEARQQLASIYSGSNDAAVKRQIIQSLMVSNGGDSLLAIAKSEKDEELRGEAIRSLAISRSTTPETLASLYTSDTGQKTKKEVVNGLLVRGDAKPLVDLARKETDPAMKKFIMERLAAMHSKEATDYMMELLK